MDEDQAGQAGCANEIARTRVVVQGDAGLGADLREGMPMLDVDAVTVRYGANTVLNGVSFEMYDEAIVVTGPSGSGKSTLLRVIAGQQRASEGSVALGGVPIAPPNWLSSSDPRVALIHQDYRLVPFLTVAENLQLACEVRHRPCTNDDVVVALADVGLDPSSYQRHPTTLSGGEQQRVAIARAVMSGCRLLIADEPTGALDAANTAVVVDLMLSLADRRGVSLLVASHDDRVIERFDRRLEFTNGELSDSWLAAAQDSFS